jgi:hypothetical protein
MSDDITKIDEVKTRIAALKDDYMRRLIPLLAELDAAEADVLRMEGLLSLEATDEDIETHVSRMG